MVAIFAALASAAFFAVSSAFQQRSASSESNEGLSGVRLMAQLAREPRWWLGLSLSTVAFALHAFALSRGLLAVVQPIIVSGLVFAVFARAALERRLPPRVTIAWCIVTWAGLAAFIAVVRSGPEHAPNPTHAAWFVAVGVVATIVLVLAARRARVGEHRGMLFGAAAGILYGLVAGLVKLVLAQASPHLWQAVQHWSFWALLLVGAGAIALNQRAFQATRLSVSMPVVNIVNVLVSIAFGVVVFSERIFSSPTTVAGEVASLAVMAIGVRQLARQEGGSSEASPPSGERDDAERPDIALKPVEQADGRGART